MHFIDINDLPVEVVRSPRRKTLAIKIREGKVSLHLPKLMPLWLAKQFVLRKQQWITLKLQDYQQRPPPRIFDQDALHPFLGDFYPLKISYDIKRQRCHVAFDQQQFKIQAPDTATQTDIHQALVRWYRRQADKLLIARAEHLEAQTGLTPNQVQIKTYKARWGSCNGRGDIQLNWQLIQASQNIIDYVIIHELCHLKQHNHSAAFWALVAQFDPNYHDHQRWLKQNGHLLVI